MDESAEICLRYFALPLPLCSTKATSFCGDGRRAVMDVSLLRVDNDNRRLSIVVPSSSSSTNLLRLNVQLFKMMRVFCRGFILVGLLSGSRGWVSGIVRHQPAMRRVSSSLRARPRDDGESLLTDDNEARVPGDAKRRDLLTKSTALLASLALGSQAAKADEDKIVLQTSAENAPVKYVETSTMTRIPSVATTKPDVMVCLDSEITRINVFERTAPSVVFIDTFTEQRDAFSTNV